MATNEAAHTPAGSAAARRAEISTPWGPSALVEEALVAQSGGGKKFTVRVQLLESSRGERLIRVAYTGNGIVRRGPVTVRARDLERLRTALGERPALAAALGLGAADTSA